MRAALQISAHETVLGHTQLQCRGTGVLGGDTAILFGQREHAHDAAQSGFALAMMNRVAHRADAGARFVGSRDQAQRMRWRAPRPIFRPDTMPTAFLLEMFAKQHAGARVEQAHVHQVPLHIDLAADPAGRRTIVGCVNLNAAIDVNRPLSILVVAERFQRQ